MKNTKLLYGGITISLMLASVFIGFMANDVIFDETKDLGSIIDSMIGKPSLPAEQTQQLTGQATLLNPENPSNPSQWQEGESVKIEMNNSRVHTDISSWTADVWQNDYSYYQISQSSITEYGLYDDLWTSDSEFWGIKVVDDYGSDYSGKWCGTFYVDIPASIPGTIYFNAYVWTEHSSSGEDAKLWGAGSYSFTSAHISAGNIRIEYYTRAQGDYDGDQDFYYTLRLANFNTNGWVTMASGLSDPDNIPESKYFYMLFDYLFVDFDTIEYNLRSEYLSVSESITQHKLTIQAPLAGTNIFVHYPPHWEYSGTINPYAVITDSDNIISFSSYSNIIYILLFTSKIEQYMALEDNSGAYLSDIGFEGSLGNWIGATTYGADSWILNSTIVSSGAFSLRMSDGDASNNFGLELPVDTIVDGYYYISFDYYLEVAPSTAWTLYYRQGSTTRTITLDKTVSDRWVKAFYFIHLTASSAYDFKFYAVGGSPIVFLDNFRVFQVNHQIETIDYFQTLFSGTMINLNGYGNQIVPYLTVSMELRLRCDDLLIKEFSDITNAYGEFSYLWEGKLDLKEYEFRSWSWDSWFGIYSSEAFEDTSLWSLVDIISINSIDSRTVLNLTATSGADDPKITFSSNLDLTYIDYWVYEAKGTVSIAHNAFRAYTDSSNVQDLAYYGTESSGLTITTSWDTYKIDTRNYVGYDLGIFDRTDLDYINHYITTDAYSLYLDNMRFIQAQKSYFTPILVSNSDYFMNDDSLTWGSDGLDFQEDAFCDFTSTVVLGSISISDGCITAISNSTSGASYMSFGGSIDLIPDEPISYWNIVQARVWTNESDITAYFKFYLDGVKKTYTHKIIIANGWTVLEWNTNEQVGINIDSFFGFYFANSTGGASYLKATSKIDWFRILHRDSDLENSYNWEFNEDMESNDGTIETTDSGCHADSGVDGVLKFENGIAYYEPATTWQGIAFLPEEYRPLDNMYAEGWRYLWIKGKASASKTVYIYGEAEWGSFLLTTEWQEFLFEIEDGDQLDDHAGWDDGNFRFETATTDFSFSLEFVRVIVENPPNLYETDNSFLLANEGLFEYITFTDSVYSGDYLNGEFIPKNLTVDSHTLSYSAYYNYFENMVTIPTVFYSYEYNIEEPGIMKIIIHDQVSNVIPFDSFKVYIDSTRLYDNYLYFTDVSQTFNLTITDLFDNMLYQDTTEDFEQFLEIQLALYSVKVQNLQNNPIWLQITRDAKTFSEWIFPYEIVKYRLESATYGFKVYYCDSISGDIEDFETNGSWVNFDYAVSADSAIMVTGQTIQDVFNNVISLTQDLDSVNASMHIAFEDQSQNFTLQFTATNQNITFMLGNSSLIINTLNSNFTSILSDTAIIIANINSLDTNIAGNFTQIFTNIANINVTTQVLGILANTSYIIAELSDIDITLASNFTFMFSNFTQIFTNIANINVTTEVLDILTDTANILGDLIILDSNIKANFTATFLGIAGNTTLLVNQLNSNFTDMQGLIISNNTVLYTQLVHTLADLAELKGLFTVHFDFVDGIGIGLSWETFKLYLNDSRQYGQDYYTPNQTQIRLSTYDYFNVSLDSANYTINNSCDISVIVDVYNVIFRNNNTQFKSIVEITRGGQSLILFVEPEGSVSHRFTEGIYTLNVSYIVESELGYDIINPNNYTIGVHDLFKESFSIGSRLKILDQTLDSNIVDVGASDPKPTLLGIVQLQIATAFFAGFIIASCISVLVGYIFKTRIIQPIDKRVDFGELKQKVQTPIVETSSSALNILPLTEKKHVKRTTEKDKRRR